METWQEPQSVDVPDDKKVRHFKRIWRTEFANAFRHDDQRSISERGKEKTTMDHYMLNTPFDFIRDRKEIFKALLDSRERGNAIGIKAAVLGKGMFVTGVDEIFLGDGEENTRIVLKGYDFTGHVLVTNSLSLDEIEGVCQFTSKFGNHILKTLSKILRV